MEKNRLYQGGALFQTIEDPMGGRGHNGASYMENGRHIVELSRTANRSTFLHEMSHIWLREIEGVILSGNAYKETQDK